MYSSPSTNLPTSSHALIRSWRTDFPSSEAEAHSHVLTRSQNAVDMRSAPATHLQRQPCKHVYVQGLCECHHSSLQQSINYYPTDTCSSTSTRPHRVGDPECVPSETGEDLLKMIFRWRRKRGVEKR